MSVIAFMSHLSDGLMGHGDVAFCLLPRGGEGDFGKIRISGGI